MVTDRTGLLLDPYFSGTKLKWILDEVGRRAREGAGGQAALRHGGQLPDLEAHRRREPCHRRDQRLPHDALRHPQGALVELDLASFWTSPWRCCPRCAIAPSDFGVTRPDLFGREIPILGVAGRPAGRDHRAGLLPAGHAEIDLRNGMFRAAQHRVEAGAVGEPSADHHRLPDGRHAHLRARRVDLRRGRRGAMAARRAADHPRGGGNAAAGRSGRTTGRTSCWCPPSPASARPTGTPNAAARSSA